VRVSVRIVEVTSSFERNLGVSWISAVGLSASEAPNVDLSGNGSPTLVNGLSLGKFNHSPVTLTATLNALETQGEAKTLANPTLLVLDGEKSFILSGQKYQYPQLSTKDSAGNPEYTIEVGVQVGQDDDMVLSLYPQVSSLVTFQPINGGNYPIINSHEEQATVRANKGDVIVLGGLRIDNTGLSSTSVPFLGNIPILGRLFSSPDRTHNTDELMIFLTPEVIEDVPPPLDLRLDVRTRGAGLAGPAPAPQ
jgi:type II secretory pathway component GspD/PulD (secretin)